jgi:hypothetical protein
MNAQIQFGARLAGVSLALALLVPCAGAQSKDRPPARPQQAAPHGAPRPSRDIPPRPQSNGGYHPQNAPRHNSSGDRQPNYTNRESRDNRPQSQARPAPAVPPPNAPDRLRNMSPQDRQKLAQREEQFRRLPPQKQQEMRQAVNNWNRMTPEQRDHIRNDVLPRWKELPPQRQKAIQQRLGVLKNMPESARNRHLDDPNFTRGMSEDDKQMLRDLSHQHVGAPDQPQE